MRQVEVAVTNFKQLSDMDPFRLDNLDTFSNLLYVTEQRVELAHLAHLAHKVRFLGKILQAFFLGKILR